MDDTAGLPSRKEQDVSPSAFVNEQQKKQAEVDGLVATAKSKASDVWATAKSKIPTKAAEKAPEEKKAD